MEDEEYDSLYKIVCHDNHWTIHEATEYANIQLQLMDPTDVDYTTMSRMLAGFAIPRCGSRRRVHKSGKPRSLYYEGSVKSLVELLKEHRGKL